MTTKPPTRTRLFKSNRTQAVRLPRAVAFPEEVTEVEITVMGASRIITPVGRRWEGYFDGKAKISDDFVRGDQGDYQEREPL